MKKDPLDKTHSVYPKKTEGRVIKIIEELDFGVLETPESEFLFFHISSFKDEELGIKDIKIGDVISCQVEEQKSDGKKAGINCKRLDPRGYLRDYFVGYGLIAPENAELFDQFCENVREAALYLLEDQVELKAIEDILEEISSCQEVIDIKSLRPDLNLLASKNKDLEALVEFIGTLDRLIRKISPRDEGKDQMRNLVKFLEILISYMKAEA